MTIRNNKEKTMADRAEEITTKYGLELPDELKEQITEPEPIEGSWDTPTVEPSMLAAYKRRRGIKDEPKRLLKDVGDFVAPGVRSGEIIERLQHQLEALSKSAEDTDQKLGDLLLKANKCTNRECRQFGQLHIHLNEGGN